MTWVHLATGGATSSLLGYGIGLLCLAVVVLFLVVDGSES